MQEQTAYPRMRHAYQYVPRPGGRGALVYAGPLQAVRAGMAGQQLGYGGYGGYGYGAGYGTGYGTYGMGYGTGYSAGYGYGGYPGGAYYNRPYSNSYSGCGVGVYGQNRYANYNHPYQSQYYGTSGSAAVPVSSYSYAYPSAQYMASGTRYDTTQQCHQQQAQPQITYITAAATPTTLPSTYFRTKATKSEIEHEKRRVATERGAYRPRRIKPADAEPDDLFWCQERDGEWHLRAFYSIENECQPGRWEMDAEKGFLVFHRD